MRISACFPTLPKLNSGKSKKSFFLKKKQTFGHIEDFCKFFNEGLNNFLRNYLQYSAKEIEQTFMKEFSYEQKKGFNAISETKSNTVPLKYTTLLSLQQNQDLSLLLWQSLDCLTLLSLGFLILYNELVMLSFPSFPFIVLFLQVFWSKFAILFKFFSKITNDFLSNFQLCFYPQCHFHFHLSKSFHCFFFLFLEPSFFSFQYQTVFFEYMLRFYTHFLQISLLGLSVNCYHWLLVLFLTCIFSWRTISKTSRRYCKFFAVV